MNFITNMICAIKLWRKRWAGNVEGMGGAQKNIQGFVGKHDGKRPLGRLKYRWADNIKMDFK
jgi:hypothetical protein